MKVAILGAGLAGLATAWHLLKLNATCKVVLYDHNGIGGGASGIAAGLVHSFAGAHARLNLFAREGMQASQQLFDASFQALGRPISKNTGLLRLAVTEQQESNYKRCAENFPKEVEWFTAEACQKIAPGVVFKPGIFIHSAQTIDSTVYLTGLWQACSSMGAQLTREKVRSLSDMSNFDAVVIAMGAASSLFPETSNLPITLIKGQILEMKWPKEIPLLSFPISSHMYIVNDVQTGNCIVGATYERKYESGEISQEIAQREILPKASQIIPELRNSEILCCRAAIRVSAPQHLPLIQQISKRCWVFTGLGSKGLLYHSLYGKKLAESLA